MWAYGTAKAALVAMAASAKEVTYQGAFGKRDLSKDDAKENTMTIDSVFWIASTPACDANA